MSEKKSFMTCDGNTATAYISYAFTEVAGIYPITPSSPMADNVDQWSVAGKKNIFGQKVNVIEMQSEAGAAGTVHGSLSAGALTTTYTASQGLLLMIPNMYKIAGELLPCVFHVSARAIASHALSIFGDHSDVMACRQTGFAMLASSSVQETVWMATVAHLATLKSKVPFLHFFDGFRTSHEIQKIEVPSYEALAELVDYKAIKAFRDSALSPNHPKLKGSAQNPDVFFQNREACNKFYNAVPDIVDSVMQEVNKLAGTNFKLFDYYGHDEADRVIVCIGSAVEAIKETVDFLNARGEKVGVVSVHLYRPFDTVRFLASFPKTVKNIAVLDRTKEPGAFGEPLYLDVVAAFASTDELNPNICGGRYGLGSKDTTPSDILAVYKHLKNEKPRHNFTISIVDDVTHLSLPTEEKINASDKSTVACRFWGLGSDGTVGANKNSIKIIGSSTDMYVQAYFSYDSKKSGGITISDLRFSKEKIRSTYLVNQADFVSCSQQSYVEKYDMLSAVKEGGVFLLNTLWSDEELEQYLPAEMKRTIALKKIKFYTIDAVSLGKKIGLGNKLNTIMQSAFFKLANIIPMDDAVQHMKAAIDKSYGKKGEDIVKMNYAAVDAGRDAIHEVSIPAHWVNCVDTEKIKRDVPVFVDQIADVINAQKGDSLPVSVFLDHVDGSMPQGTAAYEKRGVATDIPQWHSETCIQCNQCAYVCPHAAIRPFLLTEEELTSSPQEISAKDGTAPYKNYKFRIQVSALDCTGCGDCVEVCPTKVKSLEMRPLGERMEDAVNWDYLISLPVKTNPMKSNSVKGTQFNKPYLEFSGACPGCGETPYAKLVTQLFGNTMMIANATGCSSIWGGSYPATPYAVDEQGRGPTWANSLFEDNAEYGLGMHIANSQIRSRLKDQLNNLLELTSDSLLKEKVDLWTEDYNSVENTIEKSEGLIQALENYHPKTEEEKQLINTILENKDYLNKRSQWIFGGDGWAYDIGFGGLDHVLSTGENVNIMVFDTEIYSNTGGQSSKSTPTGAVAQFAAGGKAVKKKDLGMMAMSYGYVYVAQISMGANNAQTLKAIMEAEAYEGPSLIIAYAPCISHYIKGGLKVTQDREKEAVDCGYWHLYRYDPRRVDQGKNPFQLDSKKPDYSKFKEYLACEGRYHSLTKKLSLDKVERIQDIALQNAKDRYLSYLRKSQEDFSEEIKNLD